MGYQTDDFYLSMSVPNNNCSIKPFVPIVITGFSDKNGSYIKGKRLTNLRDFFDEPVKSSSLGIQIGEITAVNEEYFDIKDVYCKMLALPVDSSHLLIPLLHSSH